MFVQGSNIKSMPTEVLNKDGHGDLVCTISDGAERVVTRRCVMVVKSLCGRF